MPSLRILTLCLLALVAACKHGSAPVAPRPEPPVPMQPFAEAARIYYDNGIAFSDSTRLVVRDSGTWRTVWRQATQTQPSPPPMRAVDFTKDMVVLVAAGRMKPGDAIRVDSVGVRGSITVLVIRTTVACQPFPSDAFPFEIVRIPRTDGQVRFSEHRERSTSCPQ